MILAPNRKNIAFTLTELLVTIAITAVVMAAIMGAYMTLQRGFAFVIGWGSMRTTQTRVLESMTLDLRNATNWKGGAAEQSAIQCFDTNAASTAPQNFLILTIPTRYDGYESSGPFAGDPGRSAGRITPEVSSTTGKLYTTGTLQVTYTQTGSTVTRTSGTTSRVVGIFPSTVSIYFSTVTSATTARLNGAALSGTSTTVMPTIETTYKTYTRATPKPQIMSNLVFLRARASH